MNEPTPEAQGLSLARRGNLREALPHLDASLEPLASRGDWGTWIDVHSHRALCLLLGGHRGEGLAAASAALAKAREGGFWDSLSQSTAGLVFALTLSGDARLALDQLPSLESALARSDAPSPAVMAQHAVALALARLNQHRYALAAWRRGRELSDALREPVHFDDWFDAMGAEVLTLAGDHAGARAQAERAIERAVALGNPFTEGLASRALGQLLAALDPAAREASERALRRAVGCFESAGASVEADHARSLLGSTR